MAGSSSASCPGTEESRRVVDGVDVAGVCGRLLLTNPSTIADFFQLMHVEAIRAIQRKRLMVTVLPDVFGMVVNL